VIATGLVLVHDALQSLMVDIDSVHQHPDNYNNGDMDAIRASVETNGLYRPVYAQAGTNHLVAGNHVWEVCKEFGAEQIPVVSLDIDDNTAYRIMVGDNWIAGLARPDNALLLDVLEKIQATEGLYGTGVQETDLDAIRALAAVPLSYDDYAQWPLIAVRVPPHVRRAYLRMTEVAVGDRERFELLLRLAGWDGKDTRGA
jgi:ParB-like chromosome segregation protein Spo0J